MLQTIEKMFTTGKAITAKGEEIVLHSHTPKDQGVFLQKIFDIIKPKQSLEVGLAYGVSTLFILEKHREYNNDPKCHVAIEPKEDTYWGSVAQDNVDKEGLSKYFDIIREYSVDILPKMYYDKKRIQYAYIDTTKLFDTVLMDFFFIDKLLDVGGVIIMDDCGVYWPGVQRVARFIRTLPHYKVIGGHGKTAPIKPQRRLALGFYNFLFAILPFKRKLYPAFNFKTDGQLGIDYQCIAFQKISEDQRHWSWFEPL